jgi:hypothetical protein
MLREDSTIDFQVPSIAEEIADPKMIFPSAVFISRLFHRAGLTNGSIISA